MLEPESANQLEPESVNQMFEVLIRFYNKYSRTYNVPKSHIEAMKEVSKNGENGKEYQTIHDLCVRRMGFHNVDKFRSLLEEWVSGNPEPLKKLLNEHASSNHIEIIQFFEQHKFTETKIKTGVGLSPTKSTVTSLHALNENFSFKLDPSAAKKLKVLSLIEEVSTADWLTNIVHKAVEQKYSEWIDKQR